MGLFDALQFDPGTFGNKGLLDRLQALIAEQQFSPAAPAQPGQPQYDPMGNYTGVTSPPTDPFGPPPNSLDLSQFKPQSPFATGASAVPFAGPLNMSAAAPPAMTAPPAQSQMAAPGMPLDITPKFPQGEPPAQMAAPGMPLDITPKFPQGEPPQSDFSAQARPQQAGMQDPQAALPAALSGGQPGFMTAYQNMLGGGGLIGSVIAGVTGQRNDPAGVAQQNLKAQYDALVPMLGQQKALLAVLNPEAGKTLIAQALDKKQYSFQKLDNDTVVRQDPMTGRVDVAYGNPERSDTVAGPDGKPIAIPPGVDRKAFVAEISKANAKAAAGEKTEVQAKAEIFANKMELSNKTIGDLQGQGTSLAGKIASGVPLGNYAQSAEYQKYKQASSNFITALLRQESGAAISKSEFERYDREYMPQPGDSSEVLAQKAEARRIAIEGMKKGAGPGYRPPTAGGLGIGQAITMPGGISIKRIN